jgi:pimeloyl-ACP methyl ester carboxylesterase
LGASRRSELRAFARARAYERRRGDARGAREGRAASDTATDAIKSKYAGAPTPLEAAAFADLMPLFFAAVQGQPADARYLAHGVPLPDARAQSLAVYDRLRADIVGFDARKLGARFEVPMFFLQGDADAFTVTSEVERYVADIAAPHKQLVLVAGGGHSAFLLRAAFLDALCTHVRPWLETERP